MILLCWNVATRSTAPDNQLRIVIIVSDMDTNDHSMLEICGLVAPLDYCQWIFLYGSFWIENPLLSLGHMPASMQSRSYPPFFNHWILVHWDGLILYEALKDVDIVIHCTGLDASACASSPISALISMLFAQDLFLPLYRLMFRDSYTYYSHLVIPFRFILKKHYPLTITLTHHNRWKVVLHSSLSTEEPYAFKHSWIC